MLHFFFWRLPLIRIQKCLEGPLGQKCFFWFLELCFNADIIIRENDAALKGLKEYQICIERLVREQKARQRKKENRLSLPVAQTQTFISSPRWIDNNIFTQYVEQSHISRADASNDSSDAELDSIYARIRELEHSIVSLGMAFLIWHRIPINPHVAWLSSHTYQCHLRKSHYQSVIVTDFVISCVSLHHPRCWHHVGILTSCWDLV